MRGTGSVSVTIAVAELFVPDHRVVPFRDIQTGALDNGLRGSLWRVPSLGWAFSTMAGRSIGLAEGALERFLERSVGRPLRGTTYKDQLAAPLTHLMLAEVHAKIQSAKLSAFANAQESDRLGKLAAAGTPVEPAYMQEFSARVLLETAYAAKMVCRGDRACTEELRIDRDQIRCADRACMEGRARRHPARRAQPRSALRELSAPNGGYPDPSGRWHHGHRPLRPSRCGQGRLATLLSR